MYYGAYQFNPVPSINFSRDYHKTDDGRLLNTTMKITLDGMLAVPYSGSGGLPQVDLLKNRLLSGVQTNGCTLLLKCDSRVVLSINPKINLLQFKPSTNNWLSSIGYTAEFEYPENVTGDFTDTAYVDSVNETWNIEQLEDYPAYSWTTTAGTEASPYLYKITHHIESKGRTDYAACNTLAGTGQLEAWENARNYCYAHLGTVEAMNGMLATPVSNLLTLRLYNYNRIQNADKYAGTYAIDENWLLFKTTTGVPGYALENYTVDIKQSDTNPTMTVGINGTIQGLERGNFTDVDIINKTLDETKFGNAQSYWNNVKTRLYPRALMAYQIALSGDTQRTLNPNLISKSVGVSPTNGTINYNYEFSNAPNMNITGAVSESISFDYSYPTDKYAQIDVLGRLSGPVIQLMNSRTPYEITASIEVVVNPITSTNYMDWVLASPNCPHGQVKALLSNIEANIDANYTVLVKTNDKIRWNPKNGNYSRNINWVYNTCSDTGTMVSVLA
jgi:hypothetical protein